MYIVSWHYSIKNNNPDDVHYFIPFILSAISSIITINNNRDKTRDTITTTASVLSFSSLIIASIFLILFYVKHKYPSETKSYINTTTPNIQPSYMPSTNIGGRRRR